MPAHSQTHPALAPAAAAAGLPSLALRLKLVWLALALSSIVQIEPSPTDVLIAGMAFGFLLLGMRIPQGLGVPLALLGVFLVFTALATVLSPDPTWTGPYFGIKIYLVASLVFFASLIQEAPERVLRTMWSGWTVAAVIAVVLGIVGYYGLVPGLQKTLLGAGRAKGLFKDPNVFGPFIIPVLIYTMSRLDSGRLLLRGALLLFLSFGLLLSFSRGAWFNFAVTLVVFLVMRFATYRSAARMMRMLTIVIGVGLAMSLAFLYAISTPEIAKLFAVRAQLIQYYDVGQGGRFTTQLIALGEIFQNPVGIGPGRSGQYFGLEPHNHYLHVLVECGWFGAIAYFSFVGLTVWKGLRAALTPSALQGTAIVAFASAAGILAESFIIDSDHWRHVFVVYAMMWGLALWVEKSAGSARSRRAGQTWS